MRKIKKNSKKICKKGKIVGIFAVAIAFGNRIARNAVYWRRRRLLRSGLLLAFASGL